MQPLPIPPNVRNPLLLTEAERKVVERDVRINSLPSGTFFLMNALAAVIAGYGLLQDSPAVVIGAMLVAMMLGPIVGLGLAVLERDGQLLLRAFGTVALGTLWVVGIGLAIGWLHRNQDLTGEIMGRTAPNVMDLMVALAGGLAGAVATVSTRLPVAVVGVGVATALVPPLVACGILLSRGEFHLASGAFLLTLTNMVAIQFASSLVLSLAARYHHDAQARSRLGFLQANRWSLVLLLVLALLLSINLRETTTRQRLDMAVTEAVRQHLERSDSRLISTKIVPVGEAAGSNRHLQVQAYVQGRERPAPADVAAAQAVLPQVRNLPPMQLQVRYVPVQIINAEWTGPVR